jgi:NADH-quinone oxidoreductase subunit J
VYARHNAVDVPALLPDGSYSEGSVSKVLQRRTIGVTGNGSREDGPA